MSAPGGGDLRTHGNYCSSFTAQAAPPFGVRRDATLAVPISVGKLVPVKTTVDISDAVLDRARRHARKSGTTLRALVEEGLRHVLQNEG
jgi:hypothetical protein